MQTDCVVIFSGGMDKACGQCPTCGEGLAAFAALNLRDPLPYMEVEHEERVRREFKHRKH